LGFHLVRDGRLHDGPIVDSTRVTDRMKDEPAGPYDPLVGHDDVQRQVQIDAIGQRRRLESGVFGWGRDGVAKRAPRFRGSL
jgi:hypothetical protein